jgi:DNA polymerase-1
MSGFALAKSLGIPTKEGEELREAYLEGFPGVAEWIEDSKEEFERTGVIKNKVGRARHLVRGKEVFDKYGSQILDFGFRKELAKNLGEEAVLNLYRDLKNSYNASLNFQIQSLAASIVNRAALKINLELKRLGIDGQVVAQIHDQLIIEVREDVVEQVMPTVQHIMENTVKLEGVTLKSPPEISSNFLEGH